MMIKTSGHCLQKLSEEKIVKALYMSIRQVKH